MAVLKVIPLFLFLVQIHGLSVNINHLLSTCADACLRGCREIRLVQEARESDGSLRHILKEHNDPKSALTEADCAAQAAIINSLRRAWGPELRIVGEEQDEDVTTELKPEYKEVPLKRDLCLALVHKDEDIVPIEDITVFCDPLDGTNEFVKGRLHNCQTLVGIAYKGEPIAGAIGLPFPTGDLSKDPTVVMGRVGVGCTSIGTPLSPTGSNGQYGEIPRPHLATGDTDFHLMNRARLAIENTFGATNVCYGGAGNKILSTALGHADCTMQHRYGGPWDTCAPAAVLKSLGGTITDMYGDELVVHHPDAPAHAPKLGYVACGPNSAIDHSDLIECLNEMDEIRNYRFELEL